MKKRMVSLLMAMFLALSLLPTTVLAEEVPQEQAEDAAPQEWQEAAIGEEEF